MHQSWLYKNKRLNVQTTITVCAPFFATCNTVSITYLHGTRFIQLLKSDFERKPITLIEPRLVHVPEMY